MLDLTLNTSDQLKKRHAKETRFKFYGRTAIVISLSFLVFMFAAILFRGMSAFQQTKIGLNVTFTEQTIDPTGERDPETLAVSQKYSLMLLNVAKETASIKWSAMVPFSSWANWLSKIRT